MDIDNLPEHGVEVATSEGHLRQADRQLLKMLLSLDQIYGWVAILEVLRFGVINRYSGGERYARFLIDRPEDS